VNSRIFKRFRLIAFVTAILLIATVSFLLLYSESAVTIVPGELKLISNDRSKTCLVFPAVTKRPPPSFGFVSWKYTIRASYSFSKVGSGSMTADNPPPETPLIIQIEPPTGATRIHFNSAEGVLEPYVMGVCIWPMKRRWKFQFAEELPLQMEVPEFLQGRMLIPNDQVVK
jgi:hypothetical protein